MVLNRRPPGFGAARRHDLTHWPVSLRTLLRRRRGTSPTPFTPPTRSPRWCGASDVAGPSSSPSRPTRRRTRARCGARCSRRSSINPYAVVAPTQSVADAIRAAFPRARVEVIPPGVDTERFTPGGGRSENPMLFCAADLLEPRKRVEELVRALSARPGRHPRRAPRPRRSAPRPRPPRLDPRTRRRAAADARRR